MIWQLKGIKVQAKELMKSRGFKPRRGGVVLCRCGVLFYVRSSDLKTKKYCSHNCYADAQRMGMQLECILCKKEYYRPPSQIKWRGSSYCSQRCKFKGRTKFMSREDSPSWRGGLTSENKLIRRSKAWQTWRQQVFERDSYTCQGCGKRGGYLEPHHIKPFAYFPNLRFEISNGLTLCRPCHMNTDSFGERGKQ